MTSKASANNVKKYVKIAREQALIGFYQNSINFYSISLDLIKQRIKDLTTKDLKEIWLKFQKEIIKEMKIMQDMLKLSNGLTNAKFDFSNDYSDDISKRRLEQQPLENFIFQNPDKRKINQSIKNSYTYGGNKKKPQKKQYTNFHPNQINEWKNDDFNLIEWRKNQNNPQTPSDINSKDTDTTLNPLEQFDLSKSNIGDTSLNTSAVSTVNKSFLRQINRFTREHNRKNKTQIPETIIEDDWEERPIHPTNTDIYMRADGTIPFPKPYKSNNYNNNNEGYHYQRSYNPMALINDVLASYGDPMGELQSEETEPFYYRNPEYDNIQSRYMNYDKGKKPKNYHEDKVSKKLAQKNRSKSLINTSNRGNKNKNNNNDNQVKRSPFLMARYPNSNGDGPDTQLIEMLEQEVVETNPNVSFDDIADLENAKKTLQETVFLPLIIPDFFKGIRRAWKGVLLYGPPGTGKTLLAKALATQGKTTFFNLHSSSFASKWRGESEKLVRIVFEMAKFYAPTTIFIDEVDALCSKRGEGNEGEASRRVKAEMLVQMDGIGSESKEDEKGNKDKDKPKLITVIGATNRPWDLDDAIRRRFEKRIYIPLPTAVGREELFKINTKGIKLGNDFDVKKLVKLSDGYSGADIANVCREAAFMPMRKNWDMNKGMKLEDIVKNTNFKENLNVAIMMNDFLQALKNISKSVSNNDLKEYDNWTKEFKSV